MKVSLRQKLNCCCKKFLAHCSFRTIWNLAHFLLDVITRSSADLHKKRTKPTNAPENFHFQNICTTLWFSKVLIDFFAQGWVGSGQEKLFHSENNSGKPFSLTCFTFLYFFLLFETLLIQVSGRWRPWHLFLSSSTKQVLGFKQISAKTFREKGKHQKHFYPEGENTKRTERGWKILMDFLLAGWSGKCSVQPYSAMKRRER